MNKMEKINKLAKEIMNEVDGLLKGTEPEPSILKKARNITKLSEEFKLPKLTNQQKERIKRWFKEDDSMAETFIEHLEGNDDTLPTTM